MHATYNKTMVTVTTLLAMAFGLAIPFLDLTPEANPLWFWLGCAVIGVLFVVFLLIPFVRGIGQRST